MRRSRDFPFDVLSVSAARHFADEVLADVPAAVLESIELMVSELATNSIRHARTGFHLAIIERAHEIRVEVTDLGGGTPTVQSPGPTDPSGRGLAIVEMFSDAWGVEYTAPEDKTVWFTLGWVPPAAVEGEREYAHVMVDQSARRSQATRMHARVGYVYSPASATCRAPLRLAQRSCAVRGS